MQRLTFLTRTTLLLGTFFAIDKVMAFGKALLFNRIVGLEGMGIFGAANNLPDYLSALLSGGALGVAFVPILRESIDREGRAQAWALFSRVLNLAFIVTGVASVAIILLAEPFVRRVIAPGFTSADQTLTISLMRLDLIAILLFSISGLVMAGLHANQHFLMPAMAPLLYNLGQLFGVTILSPAEGLIVGGIELPHFGLGLYGLVYGVIIGASLHLLIQVPALIRYQFRWIPGIEVRSPAIQRVLVLLGPRVLTMACIQAYFVARDSLGSRFDSVGVGALNLAWTIEQVPETIIGSAMAVALLPSLAAFVDKGQFDTFTQTVNRALRIMLALGLPSAVLIGLTVRPFAEAFFEFSPDRLSMLTWCTWAFLLGLVGDTWLEVAVRSHYANLNTRTPLIAALLQVTAFIGLAILLPRWIGLPGIPLAAAITFSTQALALLLILNRQYRGVLDIGGTALRASVAAIAAGGIGLLALRYLQVGGVLAAAVALLAGGAVTVPIIWKELRMLMRL